MRTFLSLSPTQNTLYYYSPALTAYGSVPAGIRVGAAGAGMHRDRPAAGQVPPVRPGRITYGRKKHGRIAEGDSRENGGSLPAFSLLSEAPGAVYEVAFFRHK